MKNIFNTNYNTITKQGKKDNKRYEEKDRKESENSEFSNPISI